MVWPSVPKGFLGARLYSAHFHYPLTSHEQWFWQVGTRLPKPKKNITVNRSRRDQISQQKLKYLQSVICHLESNPFILAIYITGSLAMCNCTPDDDIDLMFITKPNSLWLARLWNIYFLTKNQLRRPPHLPEHSSTRVNNKICDNLYLDDLRISAQNLYLAHEILQAKPVYDPFNTRRQFLLNNPWVGDFLPIAYRETLKKTPTSKLITKTHWSLIFGLWSLNLIAFAIQYLYMQRKITHEKVSFRQAFFHPNQIMV